MTRIIPSLTIGLLLVSLPALNWAEEINVKKLHKVDWLRLESDNFVVVTDAKEKKAAEVVSELERFAYFMEMMLGYEQNERVLKVPVIAAEKRGTYKALGIPRDYVGVFSRDGYGGMTIFAHAKGFASASSGRGNRGRAVVLHELVHMHINNSTLRFANPPWFSEGIAEYFGTYMEKKDTIILGDVSVVKNRFWSMISRVGRVESVDTESLFKTTPEEISVVNDRTRKQDEFIQEFYARSFAVVHYLNADPDRRRKMFRYLYALEKGFSVDESFPHMFEMEFADLDKQVDDYIRGRYMMARVFPMGKDGVQFPEFAYNTRKMSKREAMGFLVSKVSTLSDDFLGEGNKEAMLVDAKAIYPDLFEQRPKPEEVDAAGL